MEPACSNQRRDISGPRLARVAAKGSILGGGIPSGKLGTAYCYSAFPSLDLAEDYRAIIQAVECFVRRVNTSQGWFGEEPTPKTPYPDLGVFSGRFDGNNFLIEPYHVAKLSPASAG